MGYCGRAAHLTGIAVLDPERLFTESWIANVRITAYQFSTFALNWHSFDDAEGGFRGEQAVEAEARFTQELPIFALCPFGAASHDHHVEINKLANVRFVTRRQYNFNDGKPAINRNGLSDVAQDFNATFIVPIMQHQFEQVEIAAGWDFFEKVAANSPDATVPAKGL